eukprot:1732242-Rhodomonas_salina.3
MGSPVSSAVTLSEPPEPEGGVDGAGVLPSMLTSVQNQCQKVTSSHWQDEKRAGLGEVKDKLEGRKIEEEAGEGVDARRRRSGGEEEEKEEEEKEELSLIHI